MYCQILLHLFQFSFNGELYSPVVWFTDYSHPVVYCSSLAAFGFRHTG